MPIHQRAVRLGGKSAEIRRNHASKNPYQKPQAKTPSKNTAPTPELRKSYSCALPVAAAGSPPNTTCPLCMSAVSVVSGFIVSIFQSCPLFS